MSTLANIANVSIPLSNLILVTPNSEVGYQPQGTRQPNGSYLPDPPTLLFDYEGQNQIMADTDSTDHYSEDNTALQNQVSIRPVEIVVSGFVGELNDIAPPELLPLKRAAERLTTVGAFVPELTTSAIIAYNRARFAYDVAANAINSATAAWSSISNAVTGRGESPNTIISSEGVFVGDNQNKQQVMFQQFFQYRNNRTLFTVQTPWAVFKNMIIKSLNPVQDEESNMVTRFDITFKQMNFARTKIISVAQEFQGRSISQASDTINFGVSTPVPSRNISEVLF